MVPDHRRLPGAFSTLILRTPALGRDQGINLDAVNIPLASVVQSVMVHVRRNEQSVAGFDRVIFAIADQAAAALDDIDFMLPLVDMVRAGAAGRYLRVGQGAGRRIIVQIDQPGRAGLTYPAARVLPASGQLDWLLDREAAAELKADG